MRNNFFLILLPFIFCSCSNTNVCLLEYNVPFKTTLINESIFTEKTDYYSEHRIVMTSDACIFVGKAKYDTQTEKVFINVPSAFNETEKYENINIYAIDKNGEKGIKPFIDKTIEPNKISLPEFYNITLILNR